MSRRFILPSAAAALLLAGCTTLADLPDHRISNATLSRSDGTPVGTAQVIEAGNRTTLVVAITGLPVGIHGVHLHTTGACAAPDFASAGGHLNPLGKKHGSMAPAGSHLGDLPNLTIRPGGNGSLTADLTGSPAAIRDWLFDSDGTAIVVHADADDYRTDPSGNSGTRIACGVLKPA